MGDAAAAALWAAHDRVARELLVLHQGREIDRSDGFVLLFDAVADVATFAIDREVHNRQHEGVVLTNLGSQELSLGNLEVAQHPAEAGLALHGQKHDRLHLGLTMALGDTLRAQGQPQQAMAAQDEAERLAQPLAQPLAPGSRLHAEISAFKQVLGREST